jgi:hypothetical protein
LAAKAAAGITAAARMMRGRSLFIMDASGDRREKCLSVGETAVSCKRAEGRSFAVRTA